MEKRRDSGGQFGGGNINIDLQLNLLSIWTKLRVSDDYQNIFLAHLDELNNRQAEELIKREISQTLQRKSFYFQLQKINVQRENILGQLKNSLQEPHKALSASEFSGIFDLLKELRETNLVAGEQILKMHKFFNCAGQEGVDRQMEYYDRMFDELDRDNKFLKQTNLANYFEFDEGYDPFLMAQYERMSRNKSDNLNPSVKDFFNISISYAYRLMKTKNMILELRSSVHPQQDPSERLRTFELENQFKVNDSALSKKRASYGSNQLSRDLNDEQSLGTERMNLNDSLPVKIQPIHIFPSTHVKSRTTIYKERDEKYELSNNDRIKQKLKLKFQRIPSRPATNTNSTNYNIEKLLKNDRSNRVHAMTEGSQVQPRRDAYPYKNSSYDSKKKKSFNDEDNPFRQQKKPLKYNAGVGQIYRSIKLSPIASHIYEGSQKKQNKSPIINEDTNNSRRDLKSFQSSNLRVSQPQERVANLGNRRDEADELNRGEMPVQNDYVPIERIIKSYNPIKKEEFSLRETQLKRSNKYDFNPNRLNGENERIIEDEDEEAGLLFEEPISKYSLKKIRRLKKADPDSSTKKIEPKQPEKKKDEKKEKANVPKIDQECQTIQMRKAEKNPVETKEKKDTSKVVPPTTTSNTKAKQKEPQSQQDSQSQPEQQQPQQKKPPPKKAQFQDSDQTLEDEDIIDERPTNKNSTKNKNLIRPVDKSNSMVKPQQKKVVKPSEGKPMPSSTVRKDSGGVQPIKNGQQSDIRSSSNKKKQIRMKVGKINVEQFLATLQRQPINGQYKMNFDLQKLKAWIKVSQTYLTQFYFGEQVAIMALCSPIPNIGMALKLWAPVSKEVDLNVSSNLFKKYVQFVQKSTTVERILYSGQGFRELDQTEFKMKKQKMYERSRIIPAKENSQQFKPFLEIECSNVKFAAKGGSKIFYSEEIQQFSQDNSFSAAFMGQANINSVPSPLQNVIKFSSKVPNFVKVNEILTSQQFDNYEASQIQCTNIDLMRFHLHSSLKSTFIAQDGFFKFTGAIHHQKENQCLVSLGIIKNNGIMYFSKNMEFGDIMQLVKKPPTAKANFTVPMFSKKLYGMMPNAPAGCYGNWQINLTWQDQMQGRLRHNMKEAVGFGPGNFKVVLEIQKVIVCGFQVHKQDFII